MAVSLSRVGLMGTSQPPRDGPAESESGAILPRPAPREPWPRPYYLEDGLRRVSPYLYTYNTWCKERWRGRELVDVFQNEFRDRPVDYYRAAMVSGQVAVNGKTVGPHHILKNGDLISHTTHRHEPPVTAEPVGVIHEDDDMVVINKPSGVPVHPAGRYNYNSVVEIMKAERGPSFSPRPCNRLDRLTSGIMFIAKHAKAAEELGAQIFKRTVRKEYVARVIGRFPDGEVVCDQPILQISPKLGLNRVRANGKAARTVFKRLAYYPPTCILDGPVAADEARGAPVDPASRRGEPVNADGTVGVAADPTSDLGEPVPADGTEGAATDPASGRNAAEGYSIVRCLPVTGRTHQLRVHLQFLGHPIQNDPIYANQRVWGFDLGGNDAEGIQNSDEDVITRLSRMGKDQVADAVAYYDEAVDVYHKKKAEKMSGEVCALCNTPLYTDPGDQELSLWLHSLRYEDAEGAWSYVSPLPAWALPPKGAIGPTQVGGMEDLVGAAGPDIVD